LYFIFALYKRKNEVQKTASTRANAGKEVSKRARYASLRSFFDFAHCEREIEKYTMGKYHAAAGTEQLEGDHHVTRVIEI
jgi:hypothetical protein